MLSGAKVKKERHSSDGEHCAIKAGEGNKIVVPALESVPLHNTQKVGNIMDSMSTRKAHHSNICKKNVPFFRKGLSYGDMLFHDSDERYARVLKMHPWWTNEMYGTEWFSETEKVCVTVSERNGMKRSLLIRPKQKSVG